MFIFTTDAIISVRLNQMETKSTDLNVQVVKVLSLAIHANINDMTPKGDCIALQCRITHDDLLVIVFLQSWQLCFVVACGWNAMRTH